MLITIFAKSDLEYGSYNEKFGSQLVSEELTNLFNTDQMNRDAIFHGK